MPSAIPNKDTKIDRRNTGARVRLASTVRHQAYAGLCGAIHKAVARRNVYVVRLDCGKTYDAAPENILFVSMPIL